MTQGASTRSGARFGHPARIARLVHTAMGIALSLLVMVIGLSGALLVFKDDYLRAVWPAARVAPDLSPAGLAHVTRAAQNAYPDAERRALVFATDHFGLHKLYLTGGRAAYLDRQGRLIDTGDTQERFEDWLFDLHHRLLAGRTGEQIAGGVGLGVVLLSVSGAFAFWPARRAWRLGLRLPNLTRVSLLAGHRTLGTLAAPLVILLALTGAALSFPQTARALFDRVGGPPPAPVAGSGAQPLDWLNAFELTQDHFPGAQPRIVLWGSQSRLPALRARQPAEWHPNGRTLIQFDPNTGDIAASLDAQTMGAGRRAWNAVYPLHAAHVGGRAYDIAVFAAGFALTTLGGLGLGAFMRRMI